MKPPLILAVAAALWIALSGMAGQPADDARPEPSQEPSQDPRIDPSTGRQIATWPKDRLFDHVHMRLELRFPDIGKAYLDGRQTLTIRPVGQERAGIVLDCDGPVVSAVTLNGAGCGFEQRGPKLVVTFPGVLERGASADLVIQYGLDFSKRKQKQKGQGLTYSPAKPDAPSLTTQFPQIHAQGQAESNSRWFPCLDHPSERLTTELVVHVEDGYEVVSNGRLVSREPSDLPGAVRWQWLQDKPHAAYLVTLVVGKLARVEVGGPDSARPGMAMPVFTPHGTEANVASTFAHTAQMMAFFEQRFGVRYPWDQYAQCIVRDFAAGGMENTGCTLLLLSASREMEAGQLDDLISHELAHQWFGDLVTCRSWDHLWVQEGWATFSEALWAEHKAAGEGEAKARAAYQRSILSNYRGQRARNRASAPGSPAIVSNRFTDPELVFRKSDDPYSKGAVILHMLRVRLGDEVFFRGARVYLERFAYKNVETDDFRRVMEEVSGQSLERFFAQWCLRPGLPRLKVEQAWDEATSTLTVSVEQTQTIDRHNPAYAITLPVLVKLSDSESRWMSIDMDTRHASGSMVLPSKPEQVSVDPNLTVLAAVRVEKPLAMWVEEAMNGPTLLARVRAVEYLVETRQAEGAVAAVAGEAGCDALLLEAAGVGVAQAEGTETVR
jgi:aminopeptidase N